MKPLHKIITVFQWICVFLILGAIGKMEWGYWAVGTGLIFIGGYLFIIAICHLIKTNT